MRRIEADIDGTETEKRLFSRFRASTAESAAVHLCHFTAFWRRLTPSTGCQEEAVKHAAVALAGAYQLFRHTDEPFLDGFRREDLEIFIIQQYNKSIEHLQRHAGSSSSESMRVTLVCCLAFISLETLRGNHDVAVTHLVNGLRILQSLPDSTFDCLADGSIFVWPPPTRDSLHMPDIIQLFARLELSACFFTYGIRPVISERGYGARRFDDGSSETPFKDIAHARRAIVLFQHDTMARLHELAAAAASGDDAAAAFWFDPVQQRTQSCLLSRSARLDALIADFFPPVRFGNTDPNTPELFDLYADLLYFRCARFLLSRVAPATSPFPAASVDPFSFHFQQAYLQIPTAPMAATEPAQTLLSSILHLASCLTTSSFAVNSTPRSLSNLHTRLLGPLFLVAAHAPDPSARTTAVKLLAQSIAQGHSQPTRDGGDFPLAAPQRMVCVVERAIADEKSRSRQGHGGSGLTTELPRALTGVGCLSSLWDALATVGGWKREEEGQGINRRDAAC
ncbi:hypothetical protein VTI74DRAFT_4170 [Chaetomium olivicolor]